MPKYNQIGLKLDQGNLVPNTKAAFSGLRIGTDLSTFTATGNSVTGNFDNTTKGSNILYVGGAWRNAGLPASNEFNYGHYQTASGTPFTVTGPAIGGWQPWCAFDGDIGTVTDSRWTNGATGSYIQIGGFGNIGGAVSRQFVAYSIYSRYYTPTAWTLEVWNGTAWVVVDTRSNSPMGNNSWATFTISAPISGEIYRFTFPDGAGTSGYIEISELKFYELAGYASTLNTVDAIIPNTATTSFAPSTLVIKDASNVEITNDAAISLYYTTNAGSTWFGPCTITQFKALNVALFAGLGVSQLRIRLQPIGAQTIKSVTINNSSTSTVLSAGGGITSNTSSATKTPLYDSDIPSFLSQTIRSTSKTVME